MLKVTINDTQEYEIALKEDVIEVNGEEQKPDLVKISPTQYHLLLNNRSYRLTILEQTDNKHLVVDVNGNHYTLAIKDHYDILLHDLGLDYSSAAKAEDVKAPMPGLVLDILANPGDEVKKDTPLLVLEAMKMENVIKASGDAVIDKIWVKPKDAVEKGQVLITFR